jgi:putative SOS response-associated peptidase YedK
MRNIIPLVKQENLADSQGEMVDVHDRQPVVLEPEDAWRWMDFETQGRKRRVPAIRLRFLVKDF